MLHALAESSFMLMLYGNEDTMMAWGILGLTFAVYRSICNHLDELELERREEECSRENTCTEARRLRSRTAR